MLKNINSLLAPLDKLIEQYKSFIGYIFIALSFLALPLIFFPTYVKDTGEQAQNILLFILFLPIFSRVFGIKLAQTIMPLRKEIGIFMGTLAFVHGGAYILEYPSFILEQSFWWQNGSITYFFAGFVALIFSIPLTLTSNKWAMRKLGKKWKLIHRGVYIIAIFTVLHVVLINWVNKGEIEYGQFIILSVYFIGKIAEWRGVRFGEKKEYKKGQKWVCVPCGFIYDPTVGDKDSNIAPGTEFTDIPDDWTCPDCGVSKSDFIPYEEGHEPHSYDAKVVGHTIMNPTTLELSIEVTEEWTAIPGQFMRFYWHDERGTFSRMYSVAEQIGKRFTFTIKLAEGGRGGKLLRELHVGDTVDIGGIHGKFTLKDTKNPKIFIATGTGLAPIYHMILRTPSTVERSLYFSVATEQELFYVEKLRAIEDLDLHIHVTREDIEGFEKGRVDITSIEALPDAEWYLCGNPKMVADAREKLQERGCEKVYFEEFN